MALHIACYLLHDTERAPTRALDTYTGAYEDPKEE
jgi:hypothetical protein